MIEKLTIFWNLVLYCFYNLQIGLHKVSRFINPIFWISKIPSVKKSFQRKRGIDDISSYIEKTVFENRAGGNSIIWARIILALVSVMIEVFFFNLVQVLLNKNLFNVILDNRLYAIIFGLTLLVPGGVVDYFTIEKKQKYLAYFETFDKIPRRRIKVYSLISAGLYILLFMSLIFSFKWLRYLP